MSKVSVEYDTKEKSLIVSVDGKKMKDVNEVLFTKYFDEERARVDLRSVTYDKDNDVTLVTKILATHGDFDTSNLKNLLRKGMGRS